MDPTPPGSEGTRAIVLAREQPFRLGAAEVRPNVCQLIGPTGAVDLEPRVMKVLVALARTPGEILTRGDLTETCWEGRIVGDDAIHRVISRLRRVAEEVGPEGFSVETITKVGYRLAVAGRDPPDVKAVATASTTAASAVASADGGGVPPRRRWLIGAGAGAALAAAGGGFWAWRRRRPALDPAVQALYDQAWAALGNGSAEQRAQAIGLLRRVVDLAPEFADGWGSLAYAYASAAADDAPQDRPMNLVKLRAAADRARQFEPNNVMADAALVSLVPIFGNWGQAEQAYGAALMRHPNVMPLVMGRSIVMLATGRMTAAARLTDRLIKLAPPAPDRDYLRLITLWGANRLEEAERAMDQTVDLFPRNPVVWFTHVIYLIVTGRPEQAIGVVENLSGRPPGPPAFDFDNILAFARAAASRSPADIDRAMTLNLAAAHQAAGYALNTLQFAAVLGRLDDAFAVAEGYFGRDFKLDGLRFSKEAATYYSQLRTFPLFMPSTAAMRADPRFDGLVQRMGLKAYWARSGTLPDYLSRPSAKLVDAGG
jgi:DNA-binding winged helix-turn-helix (wHTH) protein/tetratricopeptide (TPR) repeat protein